jgi:hypothetical protein
MEGSRRFFFIAAIVFNDEFGTTVDEDFAHLVMLLDRSNDSDAGVTTRLQRPVVIRPYGNGQI